MPASFSLGAITRDGKYGHVHALSHFVNCVVNDLPIAPYGATFEDGYRIQVIMDSMKETSETGKRINLA